MEEKRVIKQEKIYDEKGKLLYTLIPNYRKTDFFMSESEIRFYKFLIKVSQEIYKRKEIKLDVFPQVAINRIITQNNEREKELEKDIFATSIDFVLYDIEKDEIYCCIELDGKEHKTDEKRKERDIIINRAFKNNVKLIRQDIQAYYDLEEIVSKIISEE